MTTSTAIEAAAQRIAGRIRTTPVLDTGDVLYKLELVQHAGSFKTRGMFNKILTAAEHGLPAAGIIAASGGNAGLAAAYAAGELGTPAEIYVPATAPPVKVAKLAKLGARVTQVGAEYAEAFEAATARAQQTGAVFCHAYDDPDMVAGNGTLGLELLGQAEFDTVLVAVGGGGLVAGVAAALHGRKNVVAVEPETSRALHAALVAGHPVDVPVSGIAADSLGARRVGSIAYETATETKLTSLLVADEAIVAARHWLWDEFRLAVEHGTAAAQAALMSGAYVPQPGERVMVLLCGANTNPSDLG
ncbi:serine/threonine dehydratase [Actinoplanes sp. N902-109]|uniref:serine/threonine dehydratase n=1 Tax=Actinoplanes sp. (strain N902-109) TaxID=649831 RepID=UPI0003293AC8|nr:serine/threonine dehydratase [Actinoplanes sp. N902-109]AGL15335.1 threonine dehydratase [Actinoplanes sp. N902-109]